MEGNSLRLTEPEYTMQSVVDRTGVPAETIRSWERRHGFPNPARGAQNQRLYSEQDIQAILQLKEHSAHGLSVKEALRLLPGSEPDGFAPNHPDQRTAPTDLSQPRHQDPHPPKVRRLTDTLLAFNGALAKALLHTELVTGSPESVAFDVILPTDSQLAGMSDPGATFAREFLRRVLISLFHASDPDTGQGTVIIAGVSGARNETLPLAHALTASRLGFITVWLGTDCDLTEVQQAISRLDPSHVILVADDMKSAATAERWWPFLADRSAMRARSRRPLVASPHPLSAGASVDHRPFWLPPAATSARVLLEPTEVDQRPAIEFVGNQ